MFNSEFTKLRKKIIEMQFSRMNSMQKKAIFTVNGPLLVLAGAGSGKTTVLVNRIANLIKFGDAYNSDEAEFEPTQRDIDIMRAYVEGECDDLFEVEDLLSVRPAQPWQILAITFTNKAARELKERLEKMLGEKAGEIWASTFHSSCAKILRKFGDRIGYTSHFTIYDTDDSRKMMKECQKQLGIEDKFLPHKTILHEISMAKDALITPSEFRKNCGADTRMLRIASAYELYQKMLKKADAMDFDDIIVNTVELLETCPDVLEYYQNKFRYIMVDEYQDTNHAQYRLVSLLASKNENICVVGDDDQSIYKFRGATIENILSFEGEYRNCVTIRLEQNYRSTQTILDAANAVIRHNEKRKGKELWTGNGEGEKITVLTAYDENDEARLIVDEIIDQSSVHGRMFSDIAVLYRMNAQSNSIEHVLTRNSIPYRIIGGLRFYDRLEIKDALSYLAVINNPSDEVRLRRIINVPKRGIGETTVSNASEIAAGLGISLFEVLEHADEYAATQRSANRLKEFTSMINDLRQMQETMPVDELFKKMLEVTGYTASLMLDADKGEERLENISELTNNLVTFVQENGEDATLNDFLEEIALMTDIDSYNAQTDAVVMMTLHSAKGLEFPVVFIPGMENGIFPSENNLFERESLEEERRLAYVGLTRAKEKLYLTHAASRMLYGQTRRNRASQFLTEVPEKLTEQKGRQPGGMFSRPSSQPQSGMNKSSSSFYSSAPKKKNIDFGFSRTEPKKETKSGCTLKVGDTVRHKVFGTGVVLQLTPMANDTMLTVAFDKAGTKKIMFNYAKFL